MLNVWEMVRIKRIIIDFAERTENHLLSERAFPIDRRLERVGDAIYLERTYRGHPEIASCRSVLLPRQHLWVLFWEGLQGPHRMRCYTHMASITDEGSRLVVEDLYLDLVLWREGGRWELVDVDEFRAAIEAGELSPEQVSAALLGLENGLALMNGPAETVEERLRQLWLPPDGRGATPA